MNTQTRNHLILVAIALLFFIPLLAAFLALLAVVLLITYVPWFSTGLLRWDFLARLLTL